MTLMEPIKTTALISDEYIEQAHYIANQNSEMILSSLGLTNKFSRKIQCACPIHGGDNPQGFSWHPIKKVWKCWTQRCHEKYGSNLIGLIRGIRQCTIDEAVEYIYELCGNSININDIKRKEFVHNKLIANEQPKRFNIDSLEENICEVSYFMSRGFTSDILHKYKCFNCVKNNHPLINRACIPLMDEENNVIGFNGRIINDSMINEFCPKWKLYPNNMAKSSILFNLNYAKSFIEKTNTVVLVEGALDSMWLSQAGIYNNVACLGIYLSTNQIKLLIKHKAKNLVIAFDPDAGGKQGIESIVNKAKLYFNFYKLDLKKDPSDYTIDEINNEIVPYLEDIYGKN